MSVGGVCQEKGGTERERGVTTWVGSTWGKTLSSGWWPEATTLLGELPRKEVIQPHLPVRLPCYDFVPIAGSALAGSLPRGLGHRLQAYPTFMT